MFGFLTFCQAAFAADLAAAVGTGMSAGTATASGVGKAQAIGVGTASWFGQCVRRRQGAIERKRLARSPFQAAASWRRAPFIFS
jgi:hypothetical protein